MDNFTLFMFKRAPRLQALTPDTNTAKATPPDMLQATGTGHRPGPTVHAFCTTLATIPVSNRCKQVQTGASRALHFLKCNLVE
jgi:hypothetical protein